MEGREWLNLGQVCPPGQIPWEARPRQSSYVRWETTGKTTRGSGIFFVLKKIALSKMSKSKSKSKAVQKSVHSTSQSTQKETKLRAKDKTKQQRTNATTKTTKVVRPKSKKKSLESSEFPWFSSDRLISFHSFPFAWASLHTGRNSQFQHVVIH